MKKTKIIATLGPSSDDPKIMEKLVEAGADVFRLNFSHGSHEEHQKRIKNLRELENLTGKPVAILQDLQGPKIRVGDLAGGNIFLQEGQTVTLTTLEPQEGEIPVQYRKITGDVNIGGRILLDDGLLELKVISKNDFKIKSKVITGGTLLSKKGINLPNSKVSIPPLTKKDRDDLQFGLAHDVDFVALSFVESAKEISELKKLIKKAGKATKVVAKVERHEAVANIDEIIKAADGIMVARGDLGIEVSLESVPLIQKDIIKKCNAAGKPVVVATQMLDSMIRNPRSTRAETSDIANAILDGADAVMLSGETSVGNYPLNAVKAMRRIALGCERWSRERQIIIGEDAIKNIRSTSEAIGKSACKLASELEARLIINATARGKTTRNVARFRPYCPIISITHTLKTARELKLVWGVIPLHMNYKTIKEMTRKSTEIGKNLKLAKRGDKIIIISGEEVGVEGGTNIIKVKEL